MPRKRPKDLRLGFNRVSKGTGPLSGRRTGRQDPTLTPLEMHPPKRRRVRK